MAARAILAGPLKLPVGVALGAADLLMEEEQALGRMLELDFGERMPGCMAGLAFTIKFMLYGDICGRVFGSKNRQTAAGEWL